MSTSLRHMGRVRGSPDLLLTLLCLSLLATAAPSHRAGAQRLPSVVAVARGNGADARSGAAFAIDGEGTLLTRVSAIGVGMGDVRVRGATGVVTGKMVGYDTWSDIAVLRVTP